jgi:predicted nucleic acid-binding protein
MTILDSTIWIALFLEKDSQHEKAKTLCKTLEEKHIGVPEYVWLEVASVLSIKGDKTLANKFLQMIHSTTSLKPLFSDPLFAQRTSTFFIQSPHSTLSFVDHALLLLSKYAQIETFDRELQKAIQL